MLFRVGAPFSPLLPWISVLSKIFALTGKKGNMMQIINGKPTYTAAEIDEMEKEPLKPNQITVPMHGMNIVVTLPDVMQSLKDAIPIVTQLFSTEPEAVTDARDLYKQLEPSYKYGPWLERRIRDNKLVEGVHYWQVAVPQTKDNMEKLSRGAPKVVTWLSLKAARKITLRETGEKSDLLFEYYDTIVNAATPYFVGMLQATEAKMREALSWANKCDAQATELAKKAGHGSVTASINYAQRERALEQALEESKKVSKSGVQAQSLTLVIEEASKYFRRVKNNPDEVVQGAEELMTALGEIQQGNLHYYPAF